MYVEFVKINATLLPKYIPEFLNKLLIFFLLFCLLNGKAFSQLSKPGKPESFALRSKEAIILSSKILDRIDTTFLLSEEKEKGISNRYGVVQQVDIDIKKEGIATIINGKGTIWQYEILAPVAYSIGIFFKTYHLPEGASVFIYNEEHSRLAGAFSSLNNFTSNQLPIADFSGSNAIIEYYEPFNASFPGTLVVGSVTQSYKSLQMPNQGRIQINCPQGANWQDVKHSVCLMTFYDSRYSYECSGFLVNNVREDGKPYFQTANHCLSTSILAATLVTYFNDENSACNSNDAKLNQTLAGATVKATNNYTDFTLLLLNEYPTANFLPYYSGWDASNSAPMSGTTIHHPSGSPKCISIDINSPTTYPYSISWQENNVTTGTSYPNTHWEVLFTSGAIESGSSGSPLFNENQLAIGQLHGGTANDDFYGKLSLSWNAGSMPYNQLKYWLDPDSTGILTMKGSYYGIKPLTRFSTSFTNICQGAPIQFMDESKYSPKNWHWIINPAGFQFVNGTDSSSQNPVIKFTTAANYTIKLVTGNSYGADSISKINYITSGNLAVSLTGLPPGGVVCGCNLNNYKLQATGADNYIFTIERPDKISSNQDINNLSISLISAEKKNGSFNSWIKVTGTQGSCTVSDSLLLKIAMPPNDDIENATLLNPGTNSSFTNYCASIQQNEPHPYTRACYNPDSWCPIFNYYDSIITHTIWFKFVGSPNGRISVDTHGFSDRIAIYEADNTANIMSGNPALYNIMAANEGRSASDLTSVLEDIPVQPYKIYWMQLEGHNKATGLCSIDLLTNSIEVYPNPSSGIFNISILGKADGIADVKIMSLIGNIIYAEKLPVSLDSNKFLFDLSTQPAGIYFIQAIIDGSKTTAKLMLLK